MPAAAEPAPSDESHAQDSILVLADLTFRARLGSADASTALSALVESLGAAAAVTPAYAAIGSAAPAGLEARLGEKLKEELALLEKTKKDAEENLGESEVREALEKIGEFWKRVAEKDKAVAAFEDVMAASVGGGQKLDSVFAIIRIGMAGVDFPLVKANIARAKAMVEKGGDWERRNRLKVYEATYCLSKRDIPTASALFLDSLATFSATELIPYKTFVFYTVVTCMITLDRPTLRDKVASAPEILAAILDTPLLSETFTAFVKCDYKTYMTNLPVLLDHLAADRYMSTHLNYICRELRVVVYSQFLASYASVTLASMSAAFGVSPPFIEREIARFIAAGRINARIDKVRGVIETTRPDVRNAAYLAAIRVGDGLLNRVQKLSRVIDI